MVKPNYAFKPIAEQALRSNQTLAPQRLNAALGLTTECFVKLPSDKHDLESVERLLQIGYPGLAPVLPELLEWMKDLNWPVAKPLSEFFARVGVPLESHIRGVFRTDDNCWKWSVLSGIVSKSPELACVLKDELERIAASPTQREVQEDLNRVCADILGALPR